ncbi:MAG TPA: glycosyltransferase [Candidatus Dormibacteraeota bacterium]|jgi:glycosyltransferase involved in cell wall biosynthesis
MRVLQIHAPYRQEGGEDAVVREEASLLRAAGHEVFEHHVPNPQARGETLAALARAPWNPASAREIREVVRRFRPDIAHVHNTWFGLSPSVPAAVHQLGVPVVMTLHNFRLMCVNGLLFRDGTVCEDCVGTHPWRGVQHRCYRGSRPLSVIAASTVALGRTRHTWDRSIDRFIAPSAFTKAKIADGGVAAEKIIVKPHGVQDPGARLRPPSASSTVLFVGRLSPEKGLRVLIDAWERVRPASLELVVVGEGPQRRLLEARRTERVRFLGWRAPAEVRRLMLSARALAFPSLWYESFALTVVEALAAGLPVLAADIGSAAAIVRTVGPEWLVSSADVEGWAAELRQLESSRAIDVAGRRARSLYEASYTPRHSVTQLENIYADVIQGRAAVTDDRRVMRTADRHG